MALEYEYKELAPHAPANRCPGNRSLEIASRRPIWALESEGIGQFGHGRG